MRARQAAKAEVDKGGAGALKLGRATCAGGPRTSSHCPYPQVPVAPPRPETVVQVRPVSQLLLEQHGCPLPPQGSQVRPASVVGQTCLPAVQKLPRPPTPMPAQQGSPDSPHEPPSPTQAPAWHTPLLLGQAEPAATHVP